MEDPSIVGIESMKDEGRIRIFYKDATVIFKIIIGSVIQKPKFEEPNPGSNPKDL